MIMMLIATMRMMMISTMIIVFGIITAMAGEGKTNRQSDESFTWCWSPDLTSRGTCVYSLRQCQEIVRLRRAGVCHRPEGRW
jgi:hypothetical protein